MKDKPFEARCSNSGFDDRWTCPGCYEDLDEKRTGHVTCPKCKRLLLLSLEYEPVCVAEIISEDEGDEE